MICHYKDRKQVNQDLHIEFRVKKTFPDEVTTSN